MSEAGTGQKPNARVSLITEDTLNFFRTREDGVNELAGLMAMRYGQLKKQRQAAVDALNGANTTIAERNATIQALRAEIAALKAEMAGPAPTPSPAG